MSPVKSRREQYSQETKAALLEAATRRFAERGFAGTALEDVATDIQATRGAVYHHFANKNALFQAVFEELETEMIRRVADASANAADAWQAALVALDTFLDHACDPVYGRVVWLEAPTALGWRSWKEREEEYAYGLVEHLITTLVDAGDLPPLPLEPMARVTFHILGSAGMALAEASDQERATVRDEYSEVIRALLSGVRLRRS